MTKIFLIISFISRDTCPGRKFPDEPSHTSDIDHLYDSDLRNVEEDIFNRDQMRFRRAEKTFANDSNEFVKSRIENGCYINSFNPYYKLSGFGDFLKWKLTESDRTGLPCTKQELEQILPIIRHENPKDLYLTTPGLRFIWIGHASCFIQMNGFRFLIDPVFSKRIGITRFIGPKRYRPPSLNVNELPDNLDAVFISHNHFDHLDYPSVKQLNKRYGERLTWFCGRGIRQWFLDSNIKNVVELDWWEELHFERNNVTIAFCPAQHWSRRTAFDMNKSLWGGFAIWDNKHKFYYVGDTGYTHNITIFKQIGMRYGPFDLSVIPIGAYEPRWFMKAQHVSPEEAVQIHIDVKSKKSIGVHWGTWALASEYFMDPPKRLSHALNKRRIDPSSFIVVKHGEIVDLS